MILRRLTKHLSDQNWFAVGLDVIVVVVGIFLGLQASEWNNDRKDNARADDYLLRIRDDLQADSENLTNRISYWQEVLEISRQVEDHQETGVMVDGSEWKTLLAYFNASQLQFYRPTTITFDELLSVGEVRLISDQGLRTALARYYSLGNGAQETFILEYIPDYRDTIRGIFPSRITSHIWTSCFDPQEYESTVFDNCEASTSQAEILKALNEVRQNPHLLNELRAWMSTLEVGVKFMKDTLRLRTDPLLGLVGAELKR